MRMDGGGAELSNKRECRQISQKLREMDLDVIPLSRKQAQRWPKSSHGQSHGLLSI